MNINESYSLRIIGISLILIVLFYPIGCVAGVVGGLSDLPLEKWDPDRQLPLATQDAVRGNCSAMSVITSALEGNTEVARKELKQAINQYGTAASRLERIVQSKIYDELLIESLPPGFERLSGAFSEPPIRISDIISAMADRSTAARDAAIRIESGVEKPRDLTDLMRASSEITLLIALLGEALMLST